MAEDLPLTYTTIELESYIPTGWALASSEPVWDGKKSALRVKVIDGSELDWELVVPKAEADEHGRIEALRRAVDRLDRERFKSFL
jgi:hypothetical protein